MTNLEYQQIVKNWENFIYKKAYYYANINKFDQMQKDDLIQIGYIAVFEGYKSYLTNGKTGNDANGLIKLYVEGRMKNYCKNIAPTIKNNYVVDEEYSYNIEDDNKEDNYDDYDDDDYWKIYYAKQFIQNNLENNLNVQLFVRYVGWDGTEKFNVKQLIEWVNTNYQKNYNSFNVHTSIFNIKRSIKTHITNKIKERKSPKQQIEKPKYKITKRKPIKTNWVDYFEKTLK